MTCCAYCGLTTCACGANDMRVRVWCPRCGKPAKKVSAGRWEAGTGELLVQFTCACMADVYCRDYPVDGKVYRASEA